MKKILINVLPGREVRVAVVTTNEGSSPTVLHDLHIEHNNNKPVQGNIYKARVSAVKDELNAAFVDFGEVKQGLLALSRLEPFTRSSESGDGSRSERRISNYVKVGDEVLVQVDKDSRAEKGASLTTRVQLHGQHIVFTANRPRNRISRMITGSEREEINQILSKIKLPKDAGLVVRTSAAGKDLKTLQQDVDECLQLVDLIQQAYKQSEAPRLLYEENNMINTVLRDNLHAQIEEILVDDDEMYKQTVDFVSNFMPDYDGKIKLYDDALPLFTRNKIEKQSNRVFDREVTLPSGGQIVLDPTEAFLAVDVNSARSKYKNNFSDMVLNTNLQAVDELFNQLCLRDIGGLIVVDFIDMNSPEDIRKVQERVERACHRDRHRTKSEPISKFGLMQLQRRRTKSSIYDTAFETCDTCSGYGRIRTVSSIAHHIFHEIEAKCYDKKVTKIRTLVTPDVAAFLTNELRSHLSVLEIQSKSTLEIIPDLDGDNSTYVIHSYRSQHSSQPRETESFSQGKSSSNGHNRRRAGARTAPAESIETAAVSRSDVEKRSKRRGSGKVAGKEEKQAPALKLGTPFIQAGMYLSRAVTFMYRRLFVADSVQSTPPASKRQPRTQVQTTPQRAKTERTRSNNRERPQRSTGRRRTASESSTVSSPQASTRRSTSTEAPPTLRGRRRSSDSTARERTQQQRSRRDDQRSTEKTQAQARTTDNSTGSSDSNGRKSRRTQRQRQTVTSQDVRDTQNRSSHRSRSNGKSTSKSARPDRQRETTEQSSEVASSEIDSDRPEIMSAALRSDSDSTAGVLEPTIPEVDQSEAVSNTQQEQEEVLRTPEIEQTNTAEPTATAIENSDSNEPSPSTAAREEELPVDLIEDNELAQSQEPRNELESVVSNGQEDDTDSSRANNDPRNRLRESVESRQDAIIEIT